MRWRENPATVRPMLATLADPPLTGARARLRAEVRRHPRRWSRSRRRGGGRTVRIWSRLGNEKTAQFPSHRPGARRRPPRLRAPLLLDGEIVALDDAAGRPGSSGCRGGSTHRAPTSSAIDETQPVALIVVRHPARRRRRPARPAADRPPARGSRRASARPPRTTIRLSEQVAGDGRALHARALAEGWEGLIVKDARVALPVRPAQPGVAQAQAPAASRSSSSAAGPSRGRRASTSARCCSASTTTSAERRRSIYVGHTGTGFNEAELARVWKLLEAARDRRRRRSPSRSRPTSRRTGCGPSSSRRSASPSGPPTTSCGIRSTRAARRQGAAERA